MNFDFTKYGISAEEFDDAKAIADRMLATGANVVFDENTMEDTATSIHNLVYMVQENLSAGAFRACCGYMRECLSAIGVKTPAEDFLFFGGRCVPAPTVFLPASTYEGLGKKMAEEVVGAIGSEEETSTEGMISALLECAAMDDMLLAYRTKSLSEALAQKDPNDVTSADGNYTILPDGSILSLHYMYCED